MKLRDQGLDAKALLATGEYRPIKASYSLHVSQRNSTGVKARHPYVFLSIIAPTFCPDTQSRNDKLFPGRTGAQGCQGRRSSPLMLI